MCGRSIFSSGREGVVAWYLLSASETGSVSVSNYWKYERVGRVPGSSRVSVTNPCTVIRPYAAWMRG